ncbi:MAG: NYN domain-containing protein [Leptolyngbya sp. SIO3F4]|nr:NYN domain-containing protein [Leptolyngbya sp. SIO3F4]
MQTNHKTIFNNLPFYEADQEQGKVSIFIDAAHVFYAASTLGIEIDYSKLVAQLVSRRQLLRAYFYTGVDPKNAKQQGFLMWMKRNGYRVITKDITTKETNEIAKPQRSVDFCVEITTDMIEQAAFCDTVILVTGDGRFTRLLNHFAYSNTRIELVSLQSITSERLLNEADRAIDFANFKDAIAKRPVTYRRSRLDVA